MKNFLSLNGCLAIKEGDFSKAGVCLNQACAMNDEIFLGTLKDMFLMAIRRHNYEVLEPWLTLTSPRLKQVMGKSEMFAKCRDFLESFVFALCDHRLEAFRKDAQQLIDIFQASVSDIMELKPFYLELASIASRMAARRWDAEAIWLLGLVLDKTVEEENLKLLEDIFFQIDMHAVLHAKTFNFGHTLEIYKAEQFAYMTLLASARREALDEKEAKERVQLVVRNQRNLMTNIARITMQDEMDIYQAWYDHMLYFYGKDGELKPFAMLMIQLTVKYWEATQPKSSRKQIRFLEQVLNPSYIDEYYQNILKQII